MCHEYHASQSVWDGAHDPDEEDEDELPSFLNEEGSEDAEVLTDGGE